MTKSWSLFLCILAVALPVSLHAQLLDEKPAPLEWVPYVDMDEQAQADLLSANLKLPELVGEGKGIFTLSVDLDNDRKPDTVLYFANRDECGVDGCLYVIVYTQNNRISAYTAYSLKVGPNGLLIDGEKVGS
jgi:hypothetical protein